MSRASHQVNFVLVDNKPTEDFIVADKYTEKEFIENMSGGNNKNNKADETEYLDLKDLQKIIEQTVKDSINNNSPKLLKKPWLMFSVVAFLGLSVIFNFYFLFGNNPKNAQASEFRTETVQIKPSQSTAIGQKEIQEFTGNNAFTEIGAKLELKKNSISTNGHGNCKTPILPPEVNGCNFALAPSLLGLPKRGVMFTDIAVLGEIQGQSQIQIDLKNYEKGSLQSQIAKIEQSDLGKKFQLPASLSNNNGLYFRLWDKGGKVSVSKITLSYFYVEDLVQVSGKINNLKSTNTEAKIYRDVNEDSRFDLQTDRLWDCSPNFPGAQKIKVSSQGNFSLKRDDNCYSETKPDSWFTDDKSGSLPPGKWLIIFDDLKTVVPFELKTNDKKVDLNLEVI